MKEARSWAARSARIGRARSTRLELATALLEYLEIFHNRQCRHSSLGMLTRFEIETRQGSPATSTVAGGQFRASTELRADRPRPVTVIEDVNSRE